MIHICLHLYTHCRNISTQWGPKQTSEQYRTGSVSVLHTKASLISKGGIIMTTGSCRKKGRGCVFCSWMLPARSQHGRAEIRAPSSERDELSKSHSEAWQSHFSRLARHKRQQSHVWMQPSLNNEAQIHIPKLAQLTIYLNSWAGLYLPVELYVCVWFFCLAFLQPRQCVGV